MSRRGALWIAFVLVHAAVLTLGFVLPNQPMGDVYNVYQPWSQRALSGAGTVGVTEAWVYPQVALVPMVFAWGFAMLVGSYPLGWALLVTACNAAGFALLVGRGRSRGRTAAAWFWLGAVALLGPVAVYRLDAITVPIAVLGCVWLVRRPWLASVLLAIGMWIKVWPAALLAAAVVAVRRRVAIVGGAAAVSAAVVLVVVAAGGAAVLFGFVAGQTSRGLQLEAVASTPYVWAVVAGVPGAAIFYASDIVTFEVAGAGVQIVSAVLTPVLVLAAAAIAVAGAVKAARGARFAALFPPLALALVLALLVTNKVGSPQFLTWLVPPVVIGLVLDHRRWRGPAVLVLFASGLTQLVYPVLYDRLLMAELTPVLILTARNALLVALLAWACVRVARVRTRPGVASRAQPSAR